MARQRKSRQKVEKKKRIAVFRWHPLWFWLPFSFLLIGFYCYYWFVVPFRSEEAVLVSEISDETVSEPVGAVDEILPVEDDYFSSEVQKIVFDVEDHVNLVPDILHLPDEQQVLHTSRFRHLEAPQVRNVSSEKNNVSENPSEPRVAIVIDDMGASPQRTKGIIALHAPLTASFVTFAPQLQKQIEQSRAAGHEIMIHVPMQPQSDIFVSEDVLRIEMSSAEIRSRFEKMLKKFDGVKGINNHMGSLFTQRADKLAPVMEILAQNHMFFLDSKTTPYSQVEQTASKYGVPAMHRHLFLDNENNLEYILRQLEKAEIFAHKNGYVIAIGHPKTETNLALKAWLKSLKHKDIKLVPLSELLNDFAE